MDKPRDFPSHDVVVAPSISVFPNPAKDVINIEMQNGMMQRVDLYNMMGQLVISKDVRAYSTQIDIQLLSDGVYFLDVYARDGVAIREKVVVF